MTKADAMAFLGVERPADLARRLGLTKQAINSWDDPLSSIQRDRVQAELFRRLMTSGLVPPTVLTAIAQASRDQVGN